VEGLRELNQAGYQVLLTGDADLTDEMFGAFGGMLVDARHARVDSEVFALYAATEADIWIGQAGGGIWLPGINGIPRLMIQAFPFGHGVANAWMHFKSVRDAHGVLVPYQKLFQDYAFEYAFLGMTVEDNSNSDIRDAIVSFLEDLDRQAKGLPVESPSFEFPPHTWAWYAKARISRAWLAKYAKAAASAGEPVRSGSEVAG
jgi:hypothetical protein